MMKGTNHFDYPTASATNYKGYRPQEAPQSNKRTNYQRVIKQESQSQRERVKQQQQRRKEMEAQEQQARLREELERKRNELLQLERRRQEALENQRRAQELAAIKIEQDKIRRLQLEQRAKQQDENANYRFREALRRLDYQRQQLNIKQRQAQQRRKANQEVEKQEREQATKYAIYLKQKEQAERVKEEEAQRAEEEAVRNGLIRPVLGKNVDYSKTCFHNPRLVYRNQPKQEEVTASQRAEQEERRQKELSAQKRLREEEARRKSLQRGQKAVQKIEAERQYRVYSEEAERQQKTYNMQRIQAGKKNQYTGLKPLTLQQMELNKRIRGEEQFQEIFVGSKDNPSSTDFATKYTILQAKYAPIPQINISDSKTSQPQEDSLQIYNRPYQNILEEDEQLQEHREIREVPMPMGEQKRPMAETRADDAYRNYPKEELNYSESEEDD